MQTISLDCTSFCAHTIQPIPWDVAIQSTFDYTFMITSYDWFSLVLLVHLYADLLVFVNSYKGILSVMKVHFNHDSGLALVVKWLQKLSHNKLQRTNG